MKSLWFYPFDLLSKVSQIEENVAALNNLSFTSEELTKIEEILKN
jgi:L-glyceraldehyde 3-phosphate reductase